MKRKYVLIRSYEAGVFAGELVKVWEKEGIRIVKLKNARRIWYWDGATTLSQLAMEGTSKPKNCKFPCEVSAIEISRVIEIIDISKKAEKSIKGVPVWEN